MVSRGQMSFNAKSPTVKRILKEASELSQNPTPDYHAEPLEENLFEWHFTLRGPPAPSPYASGIYHGRVILPPTYPLRPPSFRFLTPTGRFEVNHEICLSISGHHEETWQPAWGIRTALVAIRAFMDSEARGQVGGVECDEGARRRMAGESGVWACQACKKKNGDIMSECEERAREAVAAATAAGGQKLGGADSVVVPPELRFASREELGNGSASDTSSNAQSRALSAQQDGALSPTARAPNPSRLLSESSSSASVPARPSTSLANASSSTPSAPSSSTTPVNPLIPRPLNVTSRNASATTSTTTSSANRSSTSTSAAGTATTATATATARNQSPEWIDRAIFGVFVALVIMLLRKIT